VVSARGRGLNMGRLEGKVTIVTGATSGIGRRTATRFIEEGAYVVLTGRRDAEGRAIARSLGDRADFVRTDVARETDVEAMIGFTVRKYGRLDCLFNNAGGPGPVGGIETVPLADANRVMAVVFGGVLLGMKHAAPIMLRQGSGSIITNGSVAGSRAGYSSSMVYSAAKAAVIHLTKVVAMQLGERNVRVNCISPGAIATGILAKALGLPTEQADASAAVVEQLFPKAQPIPRAGLPDDVASLAVFLASDESSFITGQDIVVDGGQITGRMWTPQQEGLDAMRRALGIIADEKPAPPGAKASSGPRAPDRPRGRRQDPGVSGSIHAPRRRYGRGRRA
jgi:NAD(P)-dependent dehydrogenase (short-subunit alcohol dehydrogenase family)